MSKTPIFGLGARPTLLLLLELVAGAELGTGFAFGAVHSWSLGGISTGGYLVVIPIALLLGLLNILVIYRAGFVLHIRSQRYPEMAQGWITAGMYGGVFLWCVVSLFLGVRLGKLASTLGGV